MNRAGLAAVLLFFCAVSAFAHSVLRRSEPKDGAHLSLSPNEIKIWFTEPLKVGLSTFVVRDPSGKQIDRGDLHADPKDPSLICLSLPPNLSPGIYKVSWSAVAPDMHVGKGGLSFEIVRAK
jgi:methionine-rich copper-binding protein CopC